MPPPLVTPDDEDEPSAPLNDPKEPPYRFAGAVLLLAGVLVLGLTWVQFRGYLDDKATLTVMSERAGLSMDPGSKVTFNGVPIGRLRDADPVTVGDVPKARLTLDVQPRYLALLPTNVRAELKATTVFGSKYISFIAPPDPAPQTLEPGAIIDAASVTTEFNTLFETVMSIAQQVDPVKLNQTLTAAAQGLDGLGDRFGQSLVDGNGILGELNARMPQIRSDTTGLAELAEVYAGAAPDLWDGFTGGVTTARTLNSQQADIDRALMASVGFGQTGADIYETGGPYLVRGAQDLLPTSELLDFYSPELLCTVRNFADVAPRYADMLGGNGYSLLLKDELVGAANPYVYPDNLPRVNARGGPEDVPAAGNP